MLRFKGDSSELWSLSDYLLGNSDRQPSTYQLKNWHGSKRRLSSLLSYWLGEVERFSLDRGVYFDIAEQDENSPQQRLLDSLVEGCKVHDLMYKCLGLYGSRGKFLIAALPDPKKFFKFYVLDGSNYCEHPTEDGYLVSIWDGKFYQRWAYTQDSIVYYEPAVQESTDWRESNSTWVGTFLAVEIGNTPIFDGPALDMATEYNALMLAGASNYIHFGGPLIISPDPKQTLAELRNRAQVLTSNMSGDTQDLGMLTGPAMPPEFEGYLDKLAQNFANHTRIAWVPPNPPSDTSSLTLRLLYDVSLRTAEQTGRELLNAFEELLSACLTACPPMDILSQPWDSEIESDWATPIFPLTPQEKGQILDVVDKLVLLGVDTREALKEYYPDMSSDEINNILQGA